MAHLYFDEQLRPEAFAVGACVVIGGEEARHAVRVSRLRAGERTLVGDGRGTVGSGVVESVDKQRFSVRLEEVRFVERPAPRLVLVQALAKGDRDERAVEQATEFGVDAVVPWQAERSVSRWGDAEKRAKGVAKWARIAREAAKQSMRGRIPEVEEPVTTAGLCERAAREGTTAVVLHPRFEEPLSAWATGLGERIAAGLDEILLVVGPEGGIDDAELVELSVSGARVLGLGDAVLRTSSAGPAALAVLDVALGRW